MATNDGEGFETLEGIGGDITVWDRQTLKEKLDDVDPGSVQLGKSFIYYIWKSLLNKWFGYKDSKVYIVTPFLDDKRLEDVCRIILHNEAEEKLAGFYVRDKCNYDRNIEELETTVKGNIEKDMKSKREAREKLQSIYDKVIDPGKTFHAKFIGCVSRKGAEVLVMSANFHASHFDCNNMDTVHYIKMTKKMFEERFLLPFNQKK